MSDVSLGSNLSGILHKRAVYQGSKAAFTFLPDHEPAVSFTYRDLDRQARIIGKALQSRAKPGERVLLIYPSGLEYVSAFCGCLCAGVIPVPVYPPRNNTKLDRLFSIVEDCQANLIVTVENIGNQMHAMPQLNGSPSLQLLNTDQLLAQTDQSTDDWDGPKMLSTDVTFLQYTSGSTASPRGVMVSHANLMHNLEAMREACEHSEDTVLVSWLPIYHDMGLIGNVLSAIYVGGHCILMSPTSFIQQPVRWLDAVSRYQGTFCAAPNFAYDLCVEKVTAEQKAALDLSSWKVAVNGAEPVRPGTGEKFLRAFEAVGFREGVFRPSYGLAEATLVVSCSRKGEAGSNMSFDASSLEQHRVVQTSMPGGKTQRVLVSCGQGLQDQKIAIVDPESLRRCPPDQVGEIWVAGPSVCQGYWRKPELSDSVFRAYTRDAGEGPFLRTGDLGFLHEGELYIAGRLKDLILVHGRNHYPQDIELTVERSHGAIRRGCGAAFSVEFGGEEHLVIVCEIKRSEAGGVDLGRVADGIRAAVAENHELEIFAIEFVKSGSIAKTSSGKLQRDVCRRNFLSCKLERLQEAESITRQSGKRAVSPENGIQRPMQFSIFYFSSNEAEFRQNKYRLFLEGAKFADDHEFSAVWIPERHFHAFGGIFPNPAVLASALAMTTKRIRIRAGSVVLPLHSPIRVAEEWSVVDNLSGGRVDLAFARGWNPNDFVLAPPNYQKSLQMLYQSLEDVRKLWRGNSIVVPNGNGEQTEIKIYPQPQQRELPVWITCSGGVERFVEAGAGGWNVLTALLFQSIGELTVKIASYREARARNGHDPDQGHVTLMLHTLVGTDYDEVKNTVRKPFIEYLRSSTDLWRVGMKALDELSNKERQDALDFAFERYYRTSGLFGTPETCFETVEQLKAAGVNEIACLIDFGVHTDEALKGLSALYWLKEKCRESVRPKLEVAGAVAVNDAHTLRVEEQRSALSQEQSGARLQSDSQTGIELAGHAYQPPAAILPEHVELRRLMAQVIAKAVSRATNAEPAAVPASRHFLSLGLNSLRAMEVVNAIEEQFDVRISYSMLFEFPTVESLSHALVREHADQLIARMRPNSTVC
jgi:natural product biosynthesis luciferase-like monooxygenase protein